MNALEVNTLGPVDRSAVSSKDPLSVCSTCFNLDPELIPPDKNQFTRFPLLSKKGKKAGKALEMTGNHMRSSAARGCISCAVLLEGVSINCSVLCNDVDWNPRERLGAATLIFYPKFGLVLKAFFPIVAELSEDAYRLECFLEFYTKNGLVLHGSNKES
jgi:hypothetical protein